MFFGSQRSERVDDGWLVVESLSYFFIFLAMSVPFVLYYWVAHVNYNIHGFRFKSEPRSLSNKRTTGAKLTGDRLVIKFQGESST